MSSVTCSELYLVDGQIDAIYSDLSSLECSWVFMVFRVSRSVLYMHKGYKLCSLLRAILHLQSY